MSPHKADRRANVVDYMRMRPTPSSGRDTHAAIVLSSIRGADQVLSGYR